jgi:hypothetical protein
LGVERAGGLNQTECKVLIDAPVARLVGILSISVEKYPGNSVQNDPGD